jgi:hypothetical protein
MAHRVSVTGATQAPSITLPSTQEPVSLAGTGASSSLSGTPLFNLHSRSSVPRSSRPPSERPKTPARPSPRLSRGFSGVCSSSTFSASLSFLFLSPRTTPTFWAVTLEPPPRRPLSLPSTMQVLRLCPVLSTPSSSFLLGRPETRTCMLRRERSMLWLSRARLLVSSESAPSAVFPSGVLLSLASLPSWPT